MKISSIENAALLRYPKERRVATLIAVVVIFWAVVAYLVLPPLWRRYESAAVIARHSMITRTAFGVPGDPLNLGFIGNEKEISCAFAVAGWSIAEKATWRASVRIVTSVLFNRPDPDAPVSALYYDGRPEDIAFEKAAGRSADSRHHVRLWRTRDAGAADREIWLAAATFDTGVGFSRYTLEVTHHIAANVDAERDFIVAALTHAGAAADVYEVAGVGKTFNGRNGGGDRYFTDGELKVISLADMCGAATPTTQVPAAPTR